MPKNNIILNIGVQLDELTRDLSSCNVTLQRLSTSSEAPDLELLNSTAVDNADYNIESEEDAGDYEEQQLEASDIEFTHEEWSSGAQTIECLSVSLEIDAAWCGPVMLGISAGNLTFEAEAHLHAGLNSFFVKSSRFSEVAAKKPLWRQILMWLLCAVVAAVVIIAGWSLVDAVWLDSNQPDQTVVTDSVSDSLTVDSVALPSANMPDVEETSNNNQQNYYQSAGNASATFADYNDFSNDSNALDEPQITPPRKEKTYGIEP